MTVSMNRAMAELLAGRDLDSHGAMPWPPRYVQIIEGGWVRRSSGALVLGWASVEPDYDPGRDFDLMGYETSVNRMDVPDDGVDAATPDALSILAARGYRLVTRLFARIDPALPRATVVGIVSVRYHYQGKPGGRIRLHEVHEGVQPYGGDLEGFAQEAIVRLEV
ncbi:hypothetical protein F0L68_05045 [Solihabitans fulvus]|uniref:Uncharacterized protein n=1 Tax=Solihabitans fulvus TaxID=1892852 RepID=A0A5B2XNB6_9PSEU|nr:hypothetical protein [Solihabitans fulvus]KAA2265217.1 hypothetical protein F0L68_05045 [Solihabitans fulvus]